MLILALIGALFLYLGLYVVWAAAHPHLGPAVSLLFRLNEALLMPQDTIFIILRGFLFVMLLYIIADAFLSPVKRHRKQRQKERRDQEREVEVQRNFPSARLR